MLHIGQTVQLQSLDHVHTLSTTKSVPTRIGERFFCSMSIITIHPAHQPLEKSLAKPTYCVIFLTALQLSKDDGIGGNEHYAYPQWGVGDYLAKEEEKVYHSLGTLLIVSRPLLHC